MANTLYGKARQAFLEKKIGWDTDNIKVYLIDTTLYNPITAVTIDTDEFITDIPVGAIIATSANLAGKTTTLGVAGCDPFTFTVVAGAAGGAMVAWQDTGVPATSRAIGWIDTAASGLPTPPGTVVVTVTPDVGANKLFKL